MITGTAKNSGKRTRTASNRNSSFGGTCTATDICKIIRACKDSGVAIFTFNGLSLTFARENLEETASQPVIVAHQEEISDNNIDHPDEKEAAEQLVHDVEEMKITDPLGYEKFLQEGVSHA